MVSIDLRPLSEETIEKMGYSDEQLWLVKIETDIYGPFEGQSLKHYVSDNEPLFERAHACHPQEQEWKPFWDYPTFQRRRPELLQKENHPGPFWLMHLGLKTGPFSFNEIDKKIEMGLLVMTDHLSTDDGDTWKKIYEIAGFDRRSHTPDDLPVAPYESSFQKAKLALVEKLETPHVKTSEELAEMAWIAQQQGKVLQFKVEEMTLQQQSSPAMSSALTSTVATVACLLLTVATSAYFLLTPPDEKIVLAEETSVEKKAPAKARRAPVAQVPTPSVAPARTPASFNQARPAYNPPAPSRFPTHVETHAQHHDPYQEPLPEVYNESEPPQLQEHSLVAQPMPEDQSLDQAMNGGMVEQPIVEEASDF